MVEKPVEHVVERVIEKPIERVVEKPTSAPGVVVAGRRSIDFWVVREGRWRPAATGTVLHAGDIVRGARASELCVVDRDGRLVPVPSSRGTANAATTAEPMLMAKAAPREGWQAWLSVVAGR